MPVWFIFISGDQGAAGSTATLTLCTSVPTLAHVCGSAFAACQLFSVHADAVIWVVWERVLVRSELLSVTYGPGMPHPRKLLCCGVGPAALQAEVALELLHRG